MNLFKWVFLCKWPRGRCRKSSQKKTSPAPICVPRTSRNGHYAKTKKSGSSFGGPSKSFVFSFIPELWRNMQSKVRFIKNAIFTSRLVCRIPNVKRFCFAVQCCCKISTQNNIAFMDINNIGFYFLVQVLESWL
jgi:hypothetical protein